MASTLVLPGRSEVAPRLFPAFLITAVGEAVLLLDSSVEESTDAHDPQPDNTKSRLRRHAIGKWLNTGVMGGRGGALARTGHAAGRSGLTEAQ